MAGSTGLGRHRPARVHVRLLGGFYVEQGARGVSLPLTLQRIVAYAALQAAWVPRARAAAQLWPDATEARAASNLRTGLWRLRGSVPVLVADATAISIAPQVEVDVHQLAELAEHIFDGDFSGLSRVRHFRAELLPGWGDEWLTIERERLRQLELHLLDAGVEACVERRRFGDAVDLAHRAIELEPLRESSHRALIETYLASGNRMAALAQFNRLDDVLQAELGLPPEEATRHLVSGLLTASGSRERRASDGAGESPASNGLRRTNAAASGIGLRRRAGPASGAAPA
jgi:DNA-binding SARP family transcriptional activator